MTVSYLSMFLDYFCPSMGVIMATVMFGAPITDLRKALLSGGFGDLNPFPWVMMSGNCLGWVVYGYYVKPRDAFIVAANLPGLLLSIWLNSGAAKLQYQEVMELKRLEQERLASQEDWNASPNDAGNAEMVGLTDSAGVERGQQAGRRQGGQSANLDQYNPEFLVTTPHERALLQLLCVWILICVWVGWIGDPRLAAPTVGIIVNINLIFFYGAPLNTIKKVVIDDRNSNSIHRPTMMMSIINTAFWVMYGLAKLDFVVVTPNAIGFSLGLVQLALCMCYPRTNIPVTTADGEQGSAQQSLLTGADKNGDPQAQGQAVGTSSNDPASG